MLCWFRSVSLPCGLIFSKCLPHYHHLCLISVEVYIISCVFCLVFSSWFLSVSEFVFLYFLLLSTDVLSNFCIVPLSVCYHLFPVAHDSPVSFSLTPPPPVQHMCPVFSLLFARFSLLMVLLHVRPSLCSIFAHVRIWFLAFPAPAVPLLLFF